MRRPLSSLLPLWAAIACSLPSAHAQEVDASHYDGTWSVRFTCPDGTACTARLALRDFEGTWQDLKGTRSSKSACGGKKIPISVQTSKLARLEFTVWGETAAPGCPTLSIMVKPVDRKSLEGSYDLGAHETESPEVHASHSAPPPSGQPASKDNAKPPATVRANPARSMRLERR